jgi:hypothetical protein
MTDAASQVTRAGRREPDDVVELASYHLELADFATVAAARAEFFQPRSAPDRTAHAAFAECVNMAALAQREAAPGRDHGAARVPHLSGQATRR